MPVIDDNLSPIDRERAVLAAMANAIPAAIVELMSRPARRLLAHPDAAAILSGWPGGATMVRQYYALAALLRDADPHAEIPVFPVQLSEDGSEAILTPAEPTPPPPPPPTPEEIAAMIAALPEGQQQ